MYKYDLIANKHLQNSTHTNTNTGEREGRGTGSRRRGGKCDREKERDQRGRENPLTTRLAEHNTASFLQRDEQQMRVPCSS